jgi:predicted ArsR family transcriptional regulator
MPSRRSDPTAHFRPQVDGDLVEDGVCAVLIAEKLGLSQPTLSEHMRVFTQAGLVRGKKIKQWTSTSATKSASGRSSGPSPGRSCLPSAFGLQPSAI